MFIIWGTRNMEKVLGHVGVNWECGHCNNQVHYKVFRRATWFTLFWIPIFPVHTEYFISCPICNYGKKTSKKEAMETLEKYGSFQLN